MNNDSAILIDTDILVDYLRGIPEAVRYLEELDVELKRDFGLADAIIAATAENLGCSLATLNRKHYPMLDAVVVPYRKE